MQRPPRRSAGSSSISIPTLVALITLIAAHCIYSGAYYGGNADIRHLLVSMQLPLLHGVEYSATPSPEAAALPVPTPSPTPAPPAEPVLRIELAEEFTQHGPFPATREEPRILIYHTHGTEAYFKQDEDEYEDNGEWRTLQNDRNIIAVGAKLAMLLQDRYGIGVIHDTTNHEPPKLATAYSRSAVTMEKYLEQYPSITMFIDVHRDSFGDDPKEPADYITMGGKEYARMMCVVGTGEGATGTGYDEMPDFEANYELASFVTDSLSAIDDGLTRSIRVKTGRYNQHISDQCLLIEVGHNANTLTQALNSIDLLAPVIAAAVERK